MQEKNNNKAKTLDPHIWTTPSNIKIIAKNILKALTKLDPKHKKEYLANYIKFIKKANDTHKQIRKILKPEKGSVFMVFHPSWGYFARRYGLKQLPIQIAGKKPKPRDLILLIKQAKTQKVRAIFTKPETPDTMVKVLADELKIPVVKISPMAPNWSENLVKLARAIAGKSGEK
jgi:zinc transport system substrate-binding protein